MPEPLYPPPPGDTGALTIPRQLNRWLDVNPQGGALTRARKYVQLPVFTAANVWGGYSQIVTSFNFEAEHNFSLRQYEVPVSTNYVLCISYRVGAAVTRYLLWDATGSNIWFNITPYAGQPILKNFRLEVWDTSQGAASQSVALTFDTSVLANRDYRWVDDSALVAPGAQVTDFWYDAATIPTLDSVGLVLSRFKSTYGVVAGFSWTSTNNVDVLLGDDVDILEISPRYNAMDAVINGTDTIAGTAQGTVNVLFVLFQYKPYTGGDDDDLFLQFNNSYEVRCGILAGDNYISVNGTKLTQSQFLVEDDLYLLVCVYGMQAFLYNISTRVATALTDITGSIGISTTLTVQGGTSKFPILEISPMYNVTDFQQAYNYFFLTYGGAFVLPLVMPVNSISVTN